MNKVRRIKDIFLILFFYNNIYTFFFFCYLLNDEKSLRNINIIILPLAVIFQHNSVYNVATSYYHEATKVWI